MTFTIDERYTRLLAKAQRRRERAERQERLRYLKAHPRATWRSGPMKPCMYCAKMCRNGVCWICWKEICKGRSHEEMLALMAE